MDEMPGKALTGDMESISKISSENGWKSDFKSIVWLGVFGVCLGPKLVLVMRKD
jgi:hypothetical protein